MKAIMQIILLLLVSFQVSLAQSSSYERMLIVESNVPESFFYSVDMKLENRDERLFLDCQSFFKQLVLYRPEYSFEGPPPFELREFELNLDAQLCNAVGEYILLEQEKDQEICLEVDLEEGALRVNPELDVCR
jgi:hypothetical protein